MTQVSLEELGALRVFVGTDSDQHVVAANGRAKLVEVRGERP